MEMQLFLQFVGIGAVNVRGLVVRLSLSAAWSGWF